MVDRSCVIQVSLGGIARVGKGYRTFRRLPRPCLRALLELCAGYVGAVLLALVPGRVGAIRASPIPRGSGLARGLRARSRYSRTLACPRPAPAALPCGPSSYPADRGV